MSTYCEMVTVYAVVLTIVGLTVLSAELWWVHGPRKGDDQ